MTMAPGVRNFALTAHVVSSVGWLGAAAAYLALAIAALRSPDVQMVRAAYLAMEPTAWFAIVPLALASLLTGLVMSLGTPWGLFRHYWVLAKLLLTVLATLVLLGHMSTVSALAEAAARTNGVERAGLWGEILHAGGGVLVLLVVTGLAVYKPRGMTPYGRRKRDAQRMAGDERGPTSTTPRWAWVSAILAVLLLLFVVLHLSGGAGRH